ncbi:MAG TPA: Obg family GTPase CgtA, partial [Acidimicrobiales bacterium]|nr:Obg family GTPase CgtA [Acidimicrobiales bacterium]
RDHPHRRATDGVHGQGKRKHGRNGEDMNVAVPEGTIVKDQDGRLLADLVHEGDRYLSAEGGRGGRGNARFLSNRRRAPSFAEQGEVGEEHWLKLELKLMADVALVGFPNVGKSTLISVISAAKPKIADYPFTTLEPNLGVVRVDDTTDFIVADIPGLIEGASEGKGLGHQFLRHVERARVLCILLDAAWESAGLPEPEEQERVLLRELGNYQPELLDRPRVVVRSRADIANSDGLSAITRQGVDELVHRLALAVQDARQSVETPSAFVVHRPVAQGFRIEREGGGWRVVGRQAERAVALSDLTNPDALAYAQRRLQKMGVDRALARAGVQEGELVRIGQLEFEYE